MSEVNSEWLLNLDYARDLNNPLIFYKNDASEVAILAKEIYQKRMKIEQNFRDDKNERYGLGWRLRRTKDINKLKNSLIAHNFPDFVSLHPGYF